MRRNYLILMLKSIYILRLYNGVTDFLQISQVIRKSYTDL